MCSVQGANPAAVLLRAAWVRAVQEGTEGQILPSAAAAELIKAPGCRLQLRSPAAIRAQKANAAAAVAQRGEHQKEFPRGWVPHGCVRVLMGTVGCTAPISVSTARTVQVVHPMGRCIGQLILKAHPKCPSPEHRCWLLGSHPRGGGDYPPSN